MATFGPAVASNPLIAERHEGAAEVRLMLDAGPQVFLMLGYRVLALMHLAADVTPTQRVRVP
jgi:hypothetical protein